MNKRQAELFIKLEMLENLRQVTGEVCTQYGFQKSAHNVDCASLFALMTLFLLIKNVKEKISITIIARDVEFVAKFALSVQ